MNKNKKEMNECVKFAKTLSAKEFEENFNGIMTLGTETSKLFPEYIRMEFKIFLKNQSEARLNLFLKNGKINGYDIIKE